MGIRLTRHDRMFSAEDTVLIKRWDEKGSWNL